MRALDIFCGGGLSSAGARAAGANLIGAIDLNPIAAQTYKTNFPGAEVLESKLERISPRRLRDEIGDIELLLASPECTNHTPAKGSAPRSERSKETALQTIRYARAFRPRWIVMENVVHMRPWSRYEEMMDQLRRLKYRVTEQVIDSSDFGVPQRRKRLFVVCDSEGGVAPLVVPQDMPKRTVRDILDPPGTWPMTKLYRPGRAPDTLERAKRAIKELGDEQPFLVVYYGTDGCGGWQSIDRPLRTVTTVDRFALVVPTADGHLMRMLQVPELMRAMGLSENYSLSHGTRRDKIRLLGNGVCPPVMEQLVRQLKV